MAAGMVDHETGTRDLSRLSGLYRAMPITATLAVVGAASMAGVPLFNGFLSKEMFFAETVFVSGNLVTRLGLPVMAVIWGTFSVAYSLRFIMQVFFGPPAHGFAEKSARAAPLDAFSQCVAGDGLPGGGHVSRENHRALSGCGGASVLGADMPFHSLAVWHGLNLPLVMSLVAMMGGIVLYRALGKYQQGAGSRAR